MSNNWIPEKVGDKVLVPLLKPLGQGLGGIFYWIFQKPIKYGIIKQAELQDLANRTKACIDQIPDTCQDFSQTGLIMRALDSSKFQINKAEFRKLFAALIASSADKRVNNVVTPRFAFILSQLSSQDARVLEILHNQPNNQLASGFLEGGYNNEISHSTLTKTMICTKDCECIYGLDASFNTLSSLGVINFYRSRWLSANVYQKHYQLIESNLKQTKQYDPKPFDKIELSKGMIDLTEFGKNFISCIF